MFTHFRQLKKIAVTGREGHACPLLSVSNLDFYSACLRIHIRKSYPYFKSPALQSLQRLFRHMPNFKCVPDNK